MTLFVLGFGGAVCGVIPGTALDFEHSHLEPAVILGTPYDTGLRFYRAQRRNRVPRDIA